MAIAIVRSGGDSGMIVVIAVVQGGGWWLPSFRAVVGCWDSQWARYCYRYQMVVVVIAVQRSHSQLVAVVVAVSRGGDDGRWWWWPLPSFGMVVVAVVHSGDGGASDGGSRCREGTYKFFESVHDYISKVSFRATTIYVLTR